MQKCTSTNKTWVLVFAHMGRFVFKMRCLAIELALNKLWGFDRCKYLEMRNKACSNLRLLDEFCSEMDSI